MSISFNQVPIDILVPGPYIEIDNSRALKGLIGMPVRVLVIGQKIAAGTAVVNTPYLITKIDQAKQLFGAGSQLAQMMERFKGVNNFTEVWAIAQDDAGGSVAATGTIVIGGAATDNGTLNVWIGGRRVQATVLTTDTTAQIATKLQAAIAANTDLCVTAAVAASTVTLTARNKGVCGNSIDVRVNYYSDEVIPSGLTATVTPMASGATNPDVTTILTAIGDEWYTDFAMPYTDTVNVVAFETELAARFGPLQMIDGNVYIFRSDTHANLITVGDTRNSPHVVPTGLYKSPTTPWEFSAMIAAACAFSSKNDPATPFQTTKLPGALAPAIQHRFTLDERDLLLRHGCGTFMIGADGSVSLERVITSYRKNGFNILDRSYLDLETMKTLAYIRYSQRTYIFTRFPNYKLANDGTNFSRGQNVVTPSVIRAALINLYYQWEEKGLVENAAQFIKDLIVERDTSDPNRVNVLNAPDLVNQLRVAAIKNQFVL